MSNLPLAAAKAPHIDWAALSPILALLGGGTLVLLLGLLRPRAAREQLVPLMSFAAFATARRNSSARSVSKSPTRPAGKSASNDVYGRPEMSMDAEMQRMSGGSSGSGCGIGWRASPIGEMRPAV